MTVTCSEPTTHFKSGCELLLHYDTDNDNIISISEYGVAIDDMNNDIITQEELDFVKTAWESSSIDALCSDCYEEERAIFSITDFTVTSLSCEEPCDIDIYLTWTNTGSIAGTKEVGFTINSKKEWWITKTLDPEQSATFTSRVSGLSAGSYIICPYPDE